MDDFEIDMSVSKGHKFLKFLCVALFAIVTLVCIAVIIKYSPNTNSTPSTNPQKLLSKTNFEVTESTTLSELYENVVNSVVTVKCSVIGSSFWNTATVVGTGIIITQAGHIVTNYNIVNNATDMTVTLNNRNSYSAKLVSADAEADIAVIKINPNEELCVACIGDSTLMNEGNAVFSIGTPYSEELYGSLSTGYISYIPRIFENSDTKYIQINTTYSLNSSSGPLFNMQGEVIGINTIKNISSNVTNMSFAIASETFKPIVQNAVDIPVSTKLGIGITGISVSDTNYSSYLNNNGFIIRSVTVDGPAAKAGLKPYDIIIKIADKDTVNADTISAVLDMYKEGDSIDIVVLRNSFDNEMTFTIILENIEYYE